MYPKHPPENRKVKNSPTDKNLLSDERVGNQKRFEKGLIWES